MCLYHPITTCDERSTTCKEGLFGRQPTKISANNKTKQQWEKTGLKAAPAGTIISRSIKPFPASLI